MTLKYDAERQEIVTRAYRNVQVEKNRLDRLFQNDLINKLLRRPSDAGILGMVDSESKGDRCDTAEDNSIG